MFNQVNAYSQYLSNNNLFYFEEYEWNLYCGVTPACLHDICKKYKISCNAYDINDTCILKKMETEITQYYDIMQ